MKKCWAFGVWKMIPLAIGWNTWKEMNQRVFEGIDMSSQDFKLYLFEDFL